MSKEQSAEASASGSATAPSTGRGESEDAQGTGTGPSSGTATRGGIPHRPTRKQKQKSEEKKFHGETAKMNGHVFQTHAERTNKSQFIETVEKLRVYC